jgi:hypothetical protein
MYEPNPVDEFRSILREEFLRRMQVKTGWGRNEIMQQYDQAVSDAIVRLMQKSITK